MIYPEAAQVLFALCLLALTKPLGCYLAAVFGEEHTFLSPSSHARRQRIRAMICSLSTALAHVAAPLSF